MSDDIEVLIDGTKSAPRVVEVDATVIAKIIMAVTHSRERPAIRAANAIADYLAHCTASSASVS